MSKIIKISTRLLLISCVVMFLAFHIDWQDSYSTIDQEGEILKTIQGTILSDWTTEPIFFRIQDSHKVIQLGPSDKHSEKEFLISPGIFRYLRSLDLTFFLFGTACFLIYLLIVQTRWWWILQANRVNIGLLQVQRLAWIGTFFSNVIPGATGGDLVKAALIIKRCPDQKALALASIVVDRVVGLTSILFLGSLASLAFLAKYPYIALLTCLGWLISTGFIIFVLYPPVWDLFHVTRLINWLPSNYFKKLSNFHDALLQNKKHWRGLGIWILVSPLVYLPMVASLFLFDRALSVGLSFIDYTLIVPLSSVVQAIPILPGGWGIGEVAYGTLIGHFGADSLSGISNAQEIMQNRGVALSVTFRTQAALWSLVGGVMLLWGRSQFGKHP